jgi:outer membrane protein assembly factor BamB
MAQVAWNWQTGAKITARPLPAGRLVVFASQDSKVYVCLTDKQKPVYRFAAAGPISASMGTYGVRLLLIPSEDNNLYALDLFTANLRWTFASGAPITQEPLTADEEIYVINSVGNLSLLDPSSGVPRWTIPTNHGEFISVGAKRIYLRSGDGDLFIVNRGTGQTLADARATSQRAGLNLRDFPMALTNHLNDRLYFATPSGLVVCLREIGQVKPLPLRNPKLPPFGTIPDEGYPDALRELGFPAGIVNPAAVEAGQGGAGTKPENPPK